MPTQFAVPVLLLAGVLTSTSPASAESSASSAITVLSVQEIIPHGSLVQPSLKAPTALVALPGGGFLISGVYRTDQYRPTGTRQFYLELSATGSVMWEQQSDFAWQTQAPTAAFLLADGGYAIEGRRFDADVDVEIKNARLAGNTNWNQILTSHQYDSLVPLAATGKLPPEIRLSEPGESRYIGCGAATKSGFILVGEAFSPPETSWRGGFPLIEMRDKAGKLLWERQYPSDRDKALEISDGQPVCGSVVVASDDSATIAMNVRIVPVTHSADEWVKVALSHANSHQAVLVIRLNPSGHEIFRALDDRLADGMLLPADKQTLLVERTAPQFPTPGSMPFSEYLVEIKKIEVTGYRVRLKYFDATSNEASTFQEIRTEPLQSLQAAYRTPEGGLLLAGCPLNGGNNYLVHVDLSGAVSSVVDLNPGGLHQCARFAIGAGVHPHEAVVFMSNEFIGARLVTVKY